MIQVGFQITQPNDKLEKQSLDFLIKKIQAHRSDLSEQIKQLRILQSIDEKAYRQQKTLLPYFTCGIFSPPFRKSENFAYIEYFIIDLDHLSAFDKNVDLVKSKLSKDDRVVLLFISPGGDGVKIMFKFKEPCRDSAKYKLFYKEFVVQFAQQHELFGVVDAQTSDVTRACFFSHDPQLYYNQNAIHIDIEPFVKNSFFDKKSEKLTDLQKQVFQTKNTEKSNITDDILQQIKAKLNPKTTTRQKYIYVPEKLDAIIPTLQKYLCDAGLNIRGIENIHYGKKITVELGLRWAEVNIFYGKKGFSVVKSPKNGSDGELCEVLYQLIVNLL